MEELAFRKLEKEGAFYPERSDYIRSLSAYLLILLLSMGGSDPEDLENRLLRDGLRLKFKSNLSDDDRTEEKNRKTEMMFSILQSVYNNGKQGK